MKVDIAVIGDGLAGHIACAHARRAGAKTALISQAMGMTALSTGALDIAFTRALSRDLCPTAGLLDHLEDIARHEPGHLFALLGVSESVRAITSGHARLGELLAHAQLQVGPLNWAAVPGLYPAAYGGLYSAATQFDSAESALEDGTWGVIGLAGDAAFVASSVVRGFALDAETAGLDIKFEAMTVEHPMPSASSLQLAAALDAAPLAETFAATLARGVRGRSWAGVILPPILGLATHARLRAHLGEAVGLPILEALSQLPSVRGVRLLRALRTSQPIEPELGQGAVKIQWSEEHPSVVVLADGAQIQTEAVILATGRAVGGGLRAPQDGLPHETLCNLALLDRDGSPLSTGFESASSPSLWAPQRLLEIRLATDKTLKPRAAATHQRLFVAGDLLVGHPQAAARIATSDGTALASGIVAAESALSACGFSKKVET